jgi:hypothetical protein
MEGLSVATKEADLERNLRKPSIPSCLVIRKQEKFFSKKLLIRSLEDVTNFKYFGRQYK